MAATPTLYLFHDPMCSWCWGYRPVSDRLVAELPAGIGFRKVAGGLAADSDEPMNAQMRARLAQTWQRIHGLLGTEFNFDFWTDCRPRRSTYPACRAVLAAGRQDRYDKMLDAIQRAYYLRAMNPSDIDTLETLAAELGLDSERFAADIRSAEVERMLQSDVALTRSWSVNGFPSLGLALDGRRHVIRRDYRDHRPTLAYIEELLAGAGSASP